MPIYPTPEQIQELLEGPADTPVVMLNLLRFAGPRVAEIGTHRAAGLESQWLIASTEASLG